MKLLSAHVTKYRSIDDSTPVAINDDVTALVGKNESGKTSFLRALYLLNPTQNEKFNVDLDFPRKDWANYKSEHDKSPATVVSADFSMEDADLGKLKEEFGPSTLTDTIFTVTKNYANKANLDIDIDEDAAIRYFLEEVQLPSEAARKEALAVATDLQGTTKALSEHADPAVKGIAGQLTARFPKGVRQAVMDWVWKRTPKFVYFSDYQIMPGTASVPHLVQRRTAKELDVGETTLVRLVSRAGLTLEELRDDKNYERHTANLEGAALAITKEVFKYWTQNKSLKVRFATSNAEPENPKLKDGPLIRVRIENTKHGVTVPFDERSRGFVWFFSFIAYFNELQKTADTDLILLLDEPGLSLHATAQSDLLRFIDETLAPTCQVLYTTHSPFMVSARQLDRVRTVQDMEEGGTILSSDVFKNDEATIFPLQAALGFEITQTLFIGPNSLLVEGPSEVLYLPQISGQLAQQKKVPLDPRWTLTPVGGIDKAPAFVSLFGAQKLNIAVVMDYTKNQKKLVDSLTATLGADKVVALHEMREGKDSDIEDLFDIDDYLTLVNETYRGQLRKPIMAGDLTHTSDRVVKRLEHYFEANHINGGRFSHGDVAQYFARNSRDFKPFGASTLKRFEALFEKVNAQLPTPQAKLPAATIGKN